MHLIHADGGAPYDGDILDRLVETFDGLGWCCLGAAMSGPHRCTCWVPVYDQPQTDPTDGTPGVRTEMCHDCAYRPDSPERADEDTAGWLLGLPDGGELFWCHQGVRRVIGWQHPAICGGHLTLPAGPGDYRPPITHPDGVHGRVHRADGTVGEICAGWAARRLRALWPRD